MLYLVEAPNTFNRKNRKIIALSIAIRLFSVDYKQCIRQIWLCATTKLFTVSNAEWWFKS